MLTSPVFTLVGFYCVIFDVAAQVRFICPRPQTALSNITQGPCGQNSFLDDFSSDFTDVKPGPLTIQWEDTAQSYGRPSRISIGAWGSTKPCVLLDRIPHNDNSTVFRPPLCKPNSYPLGSCQTSGTYITIQIPNINCTRCYLQLISVVTDGSPCLVDDSSSSNCSVYYSCAKIRISPSNVAAEGIESCGNVTTPINNWPYPVTLMYKGNTSETPMEGQLIIVTEKPDQQPGSSIVQYVVDFTQVRTPQVGSASLHFILSNGESAQFFTLIQGALYGKYRGTIPFSVKGELRIALRANRWFLRLGILPSSPYPVPHHDFYLIKSGQVYTDLSGTYSPGGWLRGEAFVGPSAMLTSVVKPSGTCSPEVETFGSAMYDQSEESIRAVLTYFVFENTLFLTGAFASPVLEMWLLQLESRHRPAAKIIFEPQMTGNVLQVSLDLTTFLQSSAGFPPYKLEAKSKRGVNGFWFRPLEADRRAVSTPIFDSRGYIVGISMLTFRQTTWVITALLINPSNTYPLAPEVSLRGPITPGFQGALLHSIPASIFDNGMEMGGWVVQATYSVFSWAIAQYYMSVGLSDWLRQTHLQNMDSPIEFAILIQKPNFNLDQTDTIFQQYLWLGMLTLILESGTHVFGGKFQPVTEPFCADLPSSFICKVTTLVQADIPDRRRRIPPSAGLVTFGLNELTETLTYSITVRELREQERVVDAFFERNGQRIGFISSQGFGTAFWNDRTIVSTGTILLSPELYEGLSNGDIYVGIITERPDKGSNSSRTDMQGALPLFQKFYSTTPMAPGMTTTMSPPAMTTAKKDGYIFVGRETIVVSVRHCECEARNRRDFRRRD